VIGLKCYSLLALALVVFAAALAIAMCGIGEPP
jgi:hypothetical protein